MPELETRLAEYISECRFGDLPEQAVELCKRLILDTLGVSIPGSEAPGCREVIELLASWPVPSGSRLLFSGAPASPPGAAFGNSMMMHALDFDDTLDESALHTFVTVLPAALAAAEQVGKVDGKRLITACVLGAETICRLSKAINRPLSWIRTATCGSFGAAAAAGKILGLDARGLHNALGLVYGQTSGNAQGLIEGRLVKRMQPGFAAGSGVLSAFLAKSGITGSRKFLEGRYGYYNLYEQGQYDPKAVLKGLGDSFAMTGLSLKPYPCCRMTHSSIDAALKIRDQVADALDQIERIRVSASKMVKDMVGGPFEIGENPQVNAQFSIPYTVSVALIKGDVFLDDFGADAIHNERVKALAEKVEVLIDGNLQEKDILPARLSVETGPSRRWDAEVAFPLGNPARPLSMDQVKDKFQKCLRSSKNGLGPKQVHRLLERIDDLENEADVRALIEAMIHSGTR